MMNYASEMGNIEAMMTGLNQVYRVMGPDFVKQGEASKEMSEAADAKVIESEQDFIDGLRERFDAAMEVDLTNPLSIREAVFKIQDIAADLKSYGKAVEG